MKCYLNVGLGRLSSKVRILRERSSPPLLRVELLGAVLGLERGNGDCFFIYLFCTLLPTNCWHSSPSSSQSSCPYKALYLQFSTRMPEMDESAQLPCLERWKRICPRRLPLTPSLEKSSRAITAQCTISMHPSAELVTEGAEMR